MRRPKGTVFTRGRDGCGETEEGTGGMDGVIEGNLTWGGRWYIIELYIWILCNFINNTKINLIKIFEN